MMDIRKQAIIQTCRNSLLAYSSFTNRNYSIQPHHRVIADILEQVERGERKKVMFFMPPRFGKSEMASINFPAWYLGRNPENELILCSYWADLANDFSRKARNRFSSMEHQIIFPTKLASDSSAADKWHTEKWWGMMSSWVEGNITGKGWHILLTDDPIRNLQDADSPLKRQRTWDWYNSDFRSRMMDDRTAEIVMMTRWHEDDLAWRLLAAENDWYTVIVPAIKKNWESNWQERFSKEFFAQVQRERWPRVWASLYMQNPKPIGGWLFKREYFQYFSQLQLDTRALDITKMERITFVDPAISMKQSADYSTIVTIGKLDWNIYILDVVRERMEPDTLINQIFEVVKLYNPSKVWVENIAFQKMLILEIQKQMDTRRESFVLEEVRPMGEKEARISSILHTKYITGKIFHLHWGENVYELEDELLCFPLWIHDDIIDALSGAIRMIGESMIIVLKWNQQNHFFPNITQR